MEYCIGMRMFQLITLASKHGWKIQIETGFLVLWKEDDDESIFVSFTSVNMLDLVPFFKTLLMCEDGCVETRKITDHHDLRRLIIG